MTKRKGIDWKYRGRTDTKITHIKVIDGRKYYRRKNGTLYPVLTSMPVSQSVLNLYAVLREESKFHSYDELLITIAEILVENNMLIERGKKGWRKTVKAIKDTEFDATLRRHSRSKAQKKGKYFRTKTAEKERSPPEKRPIP